ncbi:MAG: hypothetical protein AAFV53_02290 [Myxococcota bacterium]
MVPEPQLERALMRCWQQAEIRSVRAAGLDTAQHTRVLHRGDLVRRGGMSGRFVGWLPRRPEPLVAWQPERFMDLCRYFDDTILHELGLWESYQAIRRSSDIKPDFFGFGAVGWMLATTVLVCIALSGPAWLAPLIAAASPLLVWGASALGLTAMIQVLRWWRRSG